MWQKTMLEDTLRVGMLITLLNIILPMHKDLTQADWSIHVYVCVALYQFMNEFVLIFTPRIVRMI